MPYIGEIAAIGTAFTWSACALFFTGASRRIGSFSMNHFRMLLAIAILITFQLTTKGTLFTEGLSVQNWILLAISGLLGFFLTDLLLFECYIDLSPRLGILIFNFYPFTSALIAWILLGEKLNSLAWLGMAVTITGIVWVVLEKSGERIHYHRDRLKRGLALALGAVVFQSFSFALAKPAMIGDGATDALTATVIRAIFGGAAFWIVSLARGKIKQVISKAKDRRAMLLIAGGAVVGPSLGVWLSMVAIKMAPIGIASTLMALMPVTILPMAAIVHHDKITLRAIIGAIIACLGTAILFHAR